jgi:hypothetical protein
VGAVPVAGRSDRAGERGDLRFPAAAARFRGPWPAGAKKGQLSQDLAAALAAEAAAEVTRLAAAAAASLAGGAGLEAAENVIRAGLIRLGAGVLEDLLAADQGYAGPRLDCGRGHQAQIAGYRDKTADTVLGRVRLRRAWYHCGQCGHGFAPRDHQLQIAGHGMSAGLRKMTARAASAVPFAQASTLLRELAGVQVTAKRAGRRAEADGAAAAARIEAEAGAIAAGQLAVLPPGEPLPDKLYAAIDGTGVPMTSKETEGRPGKGDDGKARTREVKMAAVFTQAAVDADGYPVRDPGSSSYLATLAPAAQFGILMAAEARRRGAGHIRQLTILGDGAPWIWNLATRHFPEATQIVDLYHAREHVHELANLAARLLAGHHDQWLAERLAELDAGDIPALLTAGHDLKFTGSLASERDKALHYFHANATRMHYAWYRSLGLFVGSGVVEAGCKSVIGQRLKLSGMRWTEHGATGIITLRCQERSNRWDQTWQPARTHAA